MTRSTPARAQGHEQVTVDADRLVHRNHLPRGRRSERLQVNTRNEDRLSGLDYVPQAGVLGEVVRSCHVPSDAVDGVRVPHVALHGEMERDRGEPSSLREEAQDAAILPPECSGDQVEQSFVICRRLGKRAQRRGERAKLVFEPQDTLSPLGIHWRERTTPPFGREARSAIFGQRGARPVRRAGAGGDHRTSPAPRSLHRGRVRPPSFPTTGRRTGTSDDLPFRLVVTRGPLVGEARPGGRSGAIKAGRARGARVAMCFVKEWWPRAGRCIGEREERE